MGNLLTTNTVKVFFNDKQAHNCTNLSITCSSDDQLIYCSFACADRDQIYSGRGYIERIMNGNFYIVLKSADDEISEHYFREYYL